MKKTPLGFLASIGHLEAEVGVWRVGSNSRRLIILRENYAGSNASVNKLVGVMTYGCRGVMGRLTGHRRHPWLA